ncbi:MAG: GFA family protein [Actinomycetota bacterium]
MSETSLTGGCLCCGVRYEITEPLLKMTYCHCTRCQRRTGTAASPQARVAPGALRFTQGAELVKDWQPPDRGFAKCFCSNCGGSLFSRNPDGTIWSVRMGTLDTDFGLKPSHRQFVAYAATWEPIPDDGVPRYDETAP